MARSAGSSPRSETLAALVGTVWTEGHYAGSVFTSTDGKDWTSVAVPDDFRDTFRLFDLAVTGDVVFAIGRSTEGATRGLRIDGDEVGAFDLPEVAEDELLNVSAIAADGDVLVLAADPGEEGDAVPSVSYRSDDAGETWSDPVELVDAIGFISGIVALGDGFLATGAAARNDAGATSAAAWFSPDGTSWASETVPGAPEDGLLFVSENADISLGTPLARGGAAAAIYVNDNAAVSAVYSRDAAGAWSMAAQTGVNSTNGADGIAMPSADGGFVAAIIGGQYARLGAVGSGTWMETEILADRQDVPWVQEIYPAEEDARLVLRAQHLHGA